MLLETKKLMIKKVKKLIGVIVKQLAIALFFASILFLIINFFFENDINLFFGILNKITIIKNETSTILEYNQDNKKLTEIPYFGELFGKIIIKSIDIELNVYHGDSLAILKKGAGHFAGSYFPGENGTIVIAAHNSYDKFGNLYLTKLGDEIIIETEYGIFKYEIYKNDILYEKNMHDIEINHEKEELMLYTCYPSGGVGYRSRRYVVYAKLIGEI